MKLGQALNPAASATLWIGLCVGWLIFSCADIAIERLVLVRFIDRQLSMWQ